MFFEWPDIDTPPLPLNHRVTRGYAPLKNGGSTIRNLRLKVCNGSVKFPRLPAYKIEVRRVCVRICALFVLRTRGEGKEEIEKERERRRKGWLDRKRKKRGRNEERRKRGL